MDSYGSNRVRIFGSYIAENGRGLNVGGNSRISITRSSIANNELASGDGAGMYVDCGYGGVTVTDSTISGNKATGGSGGGIYVKGGTVTLGDADDTSSRVEVIGNSAGANGGGVCVAGGTLNLNRGYIGTTASGKGNAASGDGGGVYVANGSTIRLAGVTSVSGNTAGASGGGFYVAGFTDMKAVTIGSNTAGVNGGGIYMADGAVLNLYGTESAVIENNTAGASGGGAYLAAKPEAFYVDAIRGNTATGGNGGGVYAAGDLSTAWVLKSITDNHADSGNGGGVYCGGTLTLDGTTVSGNSAKSGGGAYCDGGKLVFKSGTLGTEASPNTASGNGGGIYIKGGTAHTISGGTIGYNTAAGYGAGVYLTGNGATLTISGGTIGYNTAADYGAGVYLTSSATLTMRGGSITANSAKGGGGVNVAGNSIFVLAGGEISGNTATATDSGGAGVYLHDGTLTMTGGAISGNTATGNGGGVYVDENSTFTMSDAPLVADGNDVYLAANKCITVAGAFDASATTPVATITPNSYAEGTQVLAESTSGLIAAYYGKFAVTKNGSESWGIDGEGKLTKQIVYEGTTETTRIKDPSQPTVIKDSPSCGELYINSESNVTGDATYYVTLSNVKREVRSNSGEGAFSIFNNNAGTTITVYITLIGENSFIADNHGGLKLTGAAGANIKVIFLTSSTGSLALGAQYGSTPDIQVERVNATFSIGSGNAFSGTSGGSSYINATDFFTAAQSSTGGSSFTVQQE